MDGALALGVRFGLYVSLGLLFGLAAFALYGLKPEERHPLRLWRFVSILAIIGILLSGLGLVSLAASMAGVHVGAVDTATLHAVLSLPGIGTAVMVRIGLLLLLSTFSLAVRSEAALAMAGATFGGTALATLAWGGHAAATDGSAGVWHLIVDAVHLLAAGAWIGAIAAFLLLMRADSFDSGVAHRALTSFARTGTLLVGTLLVTGALNASILVGPENVTSLPSTSYGVALLLKLVLFLVMLALAALNRFRLAPQLATGGSEGSRSAIRRSLILEVAAGVAILAVVAWLGMSVPPST